MVGEVVVAAGATLSIAPGVRVEFAGPYALEVGGRILALGAPDARIVFTSAHPEAFAVDSTQTGCWRGLRFPWTPSTQGGSRLEYCVLEYAKGAGDGSRGGALSVVGPSRLQVSDCIFRHNAADYGAVLFCSHFAAPRLSGCLMVDNHAFVGGAAVFCMDAYPRLVASTIVGNEVLNPDPWHATGVIHQHIAKALVAGNILWSNPSHYFLPGQIREGKGFYVTMNDIELGHPGEGNFDEDPRFVDQGDHAFALLGDSPCIDAGPADTSGLGIAAHDLAGGARVRGGRIDAGAYEWREPAAAPEARSATTLRLTAEANPCAGRAWLRLALDRPGEVRVAIVDVAGRRVAEIARGFFTAGEHFVSWDGRAADGSPAPAGVYFARARAGSRMAATTLLRASGR
ncbi:MAG: hypothetical protein FJY75_01860 [Candidatus Eisenbacteria bacterium]|uniref:FlgD/Vpr Ig-like domain-containing protein n=1 Tax=Eiseniibacteriota bacterium TaxID=2212470 RepID=A0A938BQ70_UNCEI|nr:hypothetical protein [Candidatus Eisenbacteria bacterium]